VYPPGGRSFYDAKDRTTLGKSWFSRRKRWFNSRKNVVFTDQKTVQLPEKRGLNGAKDRSTSGKTWF